jgi:hypothetical protein
VAVLPFSNLSSDPANAYFADGIAETLITMLTQVPKLMVIGKVSSFSYKVGWRNLAVDPAYDGIRGDPRFRGLSDQLKAADAAAHARFRARPDLNDADIESLGM